jgi:hypothetical protein
MPFQLTKKATIVAALVVLGLLGCGAGAPSAAAGKQPFVWGAWIGKQFTGSEPPWSWKAVTDFEARNAGGRHLTAVHWGVGLPWDHSFRYWLLPLNRVRQEHATSVVDMDTGSVPLHDIADGAYDAALRSWASGAKRWGHRFLLRLDWEMNGSWFPWGTTASNQNTPADFVAAWRHVHDLFRAAGATNVRWVWCPNASPGEKLADLAVLYPGSEYVDWTCLDAYNKGNPWTSFTKLFAASYRHLMRLAPAKPVLVGEVASTEHGGSKARWISGMFKVLPVRFPHIRGLLWYDKYGSLGIADWPIETSAAASTAFRRGLMATLRTACRHLRGHHRCS